MCLQAVGMHEPPGETLTPNIFCLVVGLCILAKYILQNIFIEKYHQCVLSVNKVNIKETPFGNN